MRNVIVLGDANVDIVVPYPRLDESREHIAQPDIRIQGGGTGANTAVALARLGVDVTFVGTVGDDQYGRFVCEDLENEGIHTAGLKADPALNTVGVFAFIDERGERYLYGWPRERQSYRQLDPLCVDDATIFSASWVHTSGMLLVHPGTARTSVIDVFRRAHEHGIPTSLDLNLRILNGELEPELAQTIERIMPYVTVLLGSGPDEFFYMGSSSDWMSNAREYVVGDRIVVVRNGAGGATALYGDNCVDCPAFQVDVCDTVGAGDVFNAGFIAAMLDHRSLRGALLEANAVSGYTVEHPGARSAPNRDELKVFITTHRTKQGGTRQ